MRLGLGTLGGMARQVQRPAYEVGEVSCGIVHLGMGNFHRAHQAVATDDALGAGEAGWGIAGISLRSPAVRGALAAQDGLYSLTLRDRGRNRHRIIGAIRQVLTLPDGPGAAIARIADPAIRIVSLTVTEKGYCVTHDGALRDDDADLRHDLKAASAPRTTLGLLAAGLRARRDTGAGPVTLLSCDNLAGNGRLLRLGLAAFVVQVQPDLATWIEENVRFPCTMVDRIVPATTDALRREVSEAFGIDDAAPVEAEPFFDWVIEDDFAAGRPEWERSGAVFVADATPFEEMKLRFLNGAHTTLAAAGRLRGSVTVAEAMDDPVCRDLMAALWRDSAATLAPGLDAAAYTDRLSQRFANTALHHRLEQIAKDGSRKVPQRLIAPLLDCCRKGLPHRALDLCVAVWLRSTCGTTEAGAALAIDDPGMASTARLPADIPAPDAIARWAEPGGAMEQLREHPDLLAGIAAAFAGVRDGGVAAAVRALNDVEETR